MINKNMYTVYDLIARESGPIFFANNHEHALRLFGQMISKTPEISADDFDLIFLGVFDSSGHVIVDVHCERVTPDSVINNDGFDED